MKLRKKLPLEESNHQELLRELAKLAVNLCGQLPNLDQIGSLLVALDIGE